MINLKEIKHCELCGEKDLQEVLNIGNHPLCDDLVPVNSNIKCTLYPITILLCENCLRICFKVGRDRNDNWIFRGD